MKSENSVKKFNVYSDSNSLILRNKKGFLIVSDFEIANGVDTCENIVLLSNDSKGFKELSFKNSIEEFISNKDIQGSYIANEVNKTAHISIESYDTIDSVNIVDTNLKLKKVSENLSEVSLDKVKSFDDEKTHIDLSNMIILKNSLPVKLLIEIYGYIKETKANFIKDLRIPRKFEDIINKNDFLVIACEKIDDESEEEISKDLIELIKKDIKKSIDSDFKKLLKGIDISFGILDYIKSENITIDDLVESGMDLCVGVEKTQELKVKMKNQLLKSLEDLNVVALLMTAIRVEEDFQNKRLREVNVDDDPAYLYTDEVLGLAISNQIAGTKATFNFKRYDEEKPGILKELGPMVDDIFAGLIAGCMSKIFEE